MCRLLTFVIEHKDPENEREAKKQFLDRLFYKSEISDYQYETAKKMIDNAPDLDFNIKFLDGKLQVIFDILP